MRRRTLIRTFIALPVTLAAASHEGISEKGVALLKRPGSATYNIFLNRGGQVAEVPDDFEFHTGDQFSIRVNLTAGGYVYVINRTLSGPASAMRDLRFEMEARSAPVMQEQQILAKANMTASDYTVVYPANGHLRQQPGWRSIPTDGMLVMDSMPGIEKLYIIVSQVPLTNFRSLVGRAPSAPTQLARVEVQQEIRTAMREMAVNTERASPPISARGVQLLSAPVVSSTSATKPTAPKQRPVTNVVATTSRPNSAVAAPVATGKPFLIELTLVHRQ